MNSLYKYLLLIPFLILGCRNNEIEEQYLGQIINTMNMNIFSNEGIKLLSIESPISNYDKVSNIFNLNETTINLYKENKPEYIINSDRSTLSNNNKLIELNGNVMVKTLIEQDDKLYADSFIWNIENSEYLLVGNVKFENGLVTLNSNRAILNKSNNIIKFFNPVKYKIKEKNETSRYEIKSENAYYNINTKSLNFISKEKRVRSKLYF